MGRIKTEQYRNIYGINRAYEETDISQKGNNKYARTLINIEPSLEEGKFRKSKGFSLVADLGLAHKIQSLAFSTNSSGTQKFTAVCNGVVFDIQGWTSTAAWTIMDNSIGTDSVQLIPATRRISSPYSVENFLVILDGTTPKKYDYFSVTELTDNHNASIGAFVGDRLWTNDVDEPALERYSAPFEIEDFTTTDAAGLVQCGDNSNSITANTTLFVPQSNSTNIIVAKENELWTITGNTPDTFQSNLYSAKYGTRAQGGLVQIGQDVLILTDDDIKILSTLNQQGIVQQGDISSPVRSLIRDDEIHKFNKSYMQNAFIMFDEKDGRDGRIYAFVPNNASNEVTKAYVYDKQQSWFLRDFNNYVFTCYAIDPKTGEVYMGDNAGRIFKFNNGTTYNGEEYRWFLETGGNDFSTPGQLKTGTVNNFIELKAEEDFSLTMELIKKSREGFYYPVSTKTINYKSHKFVHGSAKYGESVYTSASSQKKYFKTGNFDELSVILYGTASAEFELKNIYLQAEVKGDS